MDAEPDRDSMSKMLVTDIVHGHTHLSEVQSANDFCFFAEEVLERGREQRDAVDEAGAFAELIDQTQ